MKKKTKNKTVSVARPERKKQGIGIKRYLDNF